MSIALAMGIYIDFLPFAEYSLQIACNKKDLPESRSPYIKKFSLLSAHIESFIMLMRTSLFEL